MCSAKQGRHVVYVAWWQEDQAVAEDVMGEGKEDGGRGLRQTRQVMALGTGGGVVEGEVDEVLVVLEAQFGKL